MKAIRQRRRIGVFVEWIADGYSDPMIDEIALCAAERDVDLLFFVGGCDAADFPVATRQWPFLYASPMVIDAAVVVSAGNRLSTAEVEVYFERLSQIPLCSVAVQWSRYPSVEVDNETGVRAGVRHLIRTHGCSRIACIRGPASSTEADKRYSAYRQVLQEFNLPFDERLVASGYYIRQHGMDAVRLFLDERQVEFDAIVAANDAMALGALEELERRKICVPEQVALFGFDDIDEGRHARPPLSTVRQPVREHARKAFELVLAQLDGEIVPQRTTIDSHLVLRKSCGCLTSRGTAVMSEPPRSSRPHKAETLESWVEGCCVDITRSLLGDAGTARDASELTDAVLTAVRDGSPRGFLSRFEQLLTRRGCGHADLLVLLPVLDAKRGDVRGYVGAVTEQAKLDELLRDTSILVSEIAERNQAELRYQAETQIDRLLRMNESLLAVRDFGEMAKVIAEQLPNLGVSGCYLCVWEGPSIPAEQARLIAACVAGSVKALPPNGLCFLAKEILPQEIVSRTTRSDLLICPMLRREIDSSAYVVIERGTAAAFVYDSLVDQIGSCFKRLGLMRQIVEEVRLREHAERERIQKEMEIATRIQTGILPRDVKVSGLEISGSIRAATEVGGDYYDVLPASDGCWIGIGDVAGHGLPAGLVMLMCQSVLGGLVRSQPDGAPEALLRVANRLLYDNIRCRMQQDEHITLSLYRFYSDGTLRFAGAHEPALVWRARTGQVERIETTGIWTGIIEDIGPMTTGEVARLELGDLLVLYTDGLTEARNAEGKTFGEDRLAATIADCHEGATSAIRERIMEVVTRWMQTQDDDMTLLVARYTG